MIRLIFIIVLALTAATTRGGELKPVTAASLGTDPTPGMVFEIELEALDGRRVRLSDHRGKVIVLNFWASWCFPCRYEMPHLQAIHERFEDRGLTVIAVAVDDELAAARAFQQRYQFSFPMLFDGAGESKRALGVEGVPETYILDRQGDLMRFEDPVTRVISARINDPTVWESATTLEWLEELVGR